MSKKSRADAKLKVLPPAQQAMIWTLLQERSYQATRAILREKHGIETSERALSEFYVWYPLSRRLEQAASFADQLKGQLAQMPRLNLDAEQLSTLGQVAFEMQAVQEQNPKLFVALRRLRQKDKAQTIEDRRVKLLEERMADAKAKIESALQVANAKGGLSPETLQRIEEAVAIL